MGTHEVGKFDAIPTTDPYDISQSTQNLWPIFDSGVKKLLGADPSSMRCALASVVKFLGNNAH